jgi:hypothetical protein
VRPVERAVGHTVTDGEELARPVEQEREVHPVDELAGGALDLLEALQQRLGGARRALERRDGCRRAAAVDEAARLAARLLRPPGELARGRARQIRQVAEQRRRIEQSRDRARALVVGREDVAQIVEPLDPRRERVEIAAVRLDRRLRDLRPRDRFGAGVLGQGSGPIAQPADSGRELA